MSSEEAKMGKKPSKWDDLENKLGELDDHVRKVQHHTQALYERIMRGPVPQESKEDLMTSSSNFVGRFGHFMDSMHAMLNEVEELLGDMS